LFNDGWLAHQRAIATTAAEPFRRRVTYTGRCHATGVEQLVLALATSPLHHRRVRIGRKDTSLRLEEPYWETLRLIAVERRIAVSQLITAIDRWRDDETNLSSAVRAFILQYVLDRWVPKAHWAHE